MSEGGGSGFLQVGGEEEEEVAELSQTPDPPSPTHTHTHRPAQGLTLVLQVRKYRSGDTGGRCSSARI